MRLNLVRERAAVGEEQVRDAAVATADDDGRAEVGRVVAVEGRGEAVEVGVREPAHVPQQLQRQVVRRFASCASGRR